jgi:hypothetical protein
MQATDVSFDPDAGKVIANVVSATVAVLKAAAESSVKRVVLTSSSSSALIPQPGVEGIVVTQGESCPNYRQCLQYLLLSILTVYRHLERRSCQSRMGRKHPCKCKAVRRLRSLED